MQGSKSYRRSLLTDDNDNHGFKNCSEICQNPGLNPLQSTCINDCTAPIIGYFCDECKKQLKDVEKRSEQNQTYDKGIEYDIGFNRSWFGYYFSGFDSLIMPGNLVKYPRDTS